MLTKQQQFLKERIESLEKELKTLRDSCQHYVGRLKAKTGEITPYACCLICDAMYGTYCEEAPDHLCHYDVNENGKIELPDGREIEPPVGWKKLRDEKRCFYCHEKEEEKECLESEVKVVFN